jgi:DNA-binding response OmpR family regulator
MPTRILTIEDDAAIRRGIVDALRFSGYEVLEAATGEAGLRMALDREFELLLLDLVLPLRPGLEILKEIRQTRPTLPMIVLTARGDEEDRVAGLRQGADDYVVKPFSVKELLARVEAVLRRSPGRTAAIESINFPGGIVDLTQAALRFNDGRRTELSSREAELLRYLAANAGRTIARDEILAYVWRIDPRGITTRAIDMHIARLREKLEDDPDAPTFIITVRGRGYMLAGMP